VEKRPDPLDVLGRCRVLDHHGEIGPAVDGEAGIFQADHARDRMAEMLDALCTSSARTRTMLGWEPREITLLADMEQNYFRS
jgi:hypothetical protein